jgi:hypothetical protein
VTAVARTPGRCAAIVMAHVEALRGADRAAITGIDVTRAKEAPDAAHFDQAVTEVPAG